MPQQVSSCVKLFADDTKLYRRVTNGSTELQADIDALVKWSKEWLLPFNSTKCRVMHLGRQNAEHSYLLDGASIQEVREERDLGVVVDDELKFHQQTAAAIAKASQMLAVVRRSFANLDEVTLPLLFKTVVRPFLEYGNTIWGTFRKNRPEAPRTRATTGHSHG